MNNHLLVGPNRALFAKEPSELTTEEQIIVAQEKDRLARTALSEDDAAVFKYVTKKADQDQASTLFLDAMEKTQPSVGKPSRLSRMTCPCGRMTRPDGTCCATVKNYKGLTKRVARQVRRTLK